MYILKSQITSNWFKQGTAFSRSVIYLNHDICLGRLENIFHSGNFFFWIINFHVCKLCIGIFLIHICRQPSIYWYPIDSTKISVKWSLQWIPEAPFIGIIYCQLDIFWSFFQFDHLASSHLIINTSTLRLDWHNSHHLYSV